MRTNEYEIIGILKLLIFCFIWSSMIITRTFTTGKRLLYLMIAAIFQAQLRRYMLTMYAARRRLSVPQDLTAQHFNRLRFDNFLLCDLTLAVEEEQFWWLIAANRGSTCNLLITPQMYMIGWPIYMYMYIKSTLIYKVSKLGGVKDKIEAELPETINHKTIFRIPNYKNVNSALLSLEDTRKLTRNLTRIFREYHPWSSM